MPYSYHSTVKTVHILPARYLPALPALPALLALLAMPGALQAAPLQLSCGPELEARQEAINIKRSGGGVVKRSAAHVLRIQAATAGGRALTFTDKAPYDGLANNAVYTFCERKGGFILIAHSENDRFSGKLINETSGQVTEGGLSVSFSHDGRAYHAVSDSNGSDHAEWAIHSLDGRTSWRGPDSIADAAGADRLPAFLSDGRWEANDEFSALAHCEATDKINWRVKLVKSDGKWQWRPRRKCPQP